MDQNQIQEDVLYIKKMIEANRRSLVDNGLSYIINGIIISIGVPLSIYMGFSGLDSYIPYFWLFLIVLMVTVNLIAAKKIEKKHKIKTFGSEVFQYVWGACGLSLVILFILSFTSTGMSSPAFITSCASILAIGYLLTGVINDLKFMKILSLLWWFTAIIAGVWEYFGDLNQLPIFFAFMVILLQLIPASIIYRKWKRVYNE